VWYGARSDGDSWVRLGRYAEKAGAGWVGELSMEYSFRKYWDGVELSGVFRVLYFVLEE